MGEERNWANQENKIIKSLLYLKITKSIKDRIIRDIQTLFETEEEKEVTKESKKRKKQN